jgi:hypothetical protein
MFAEHLFIFLRFVGFPMKFNTPRNLELVLHLVREFLFVYYRYQQVIDR